MRQWWSEYLKRVRAEPELGRVVVITPTYNRKKLLEQTIDSVVAQTYKNWEMYVLDDCSTDGTGDMIDRKYADDPRIKYLFIEKKSNPVQLNELGCRIAMRCGEFWTRLSSDDLFKSGKLETDAAFLNNNQKFGACYGPFDKIDVDGNVIGPGEESYPVDTNNMPAEIRNKFFMSWANICVRTSTLGLMLKRWGHFSHDSLTNMEDWTFNAKLISVAHVGWTNSAPMAQYRIHGGQAAKNKFMIGKDYTFNRELIMDICKAKPVRDLKDLINVPEYGQHLAEEHGAEESIIMGNTRNWQQSFRAQELIPKDAKLVLDLGCGRGYWTKRITSLLNGGKCIGTDIDEMFVNAGRKEFGLDLRVMDYHRLEFPDGMFGAIYADNCIEHSPRPDVVLMEINRVLKMGGTFVLLIPPDKIGYPMLNNPYHVWKVDKKIMKESLEWAGFDIQEFIEFDLVKENALLYHESGNIMFIIKGKKIKNVV